MNSDTLTLDVSWMPRAEVIAILVESKRLLAICDAIHTDAMYAWESAWEAFDASARKLPYCSMSSGMTLRARVQATDIPSS